MSCICQGCGVRYKIDLIIPNELWLKISPKKSEGGLLCGSCIMKKLEEVLSYDSFKLTKI